MLRAAIIGAGRISWAYDGGRWDGETRAVSLASCMDKHPEVRLVAVFDPVSEARQRFSAGYQGPGPVKIFDNLTALLNERPDIVAIASPTEFHAEHIAACFDASIPRLWIEKPATLQLGELKSLLLHMGQLTHRPRTCVNYLRRCLPQIDYMKAHLAAADPDRPVRMNVSYSRGLAVNGVHMLDLVGVLLGAQEAPELEFCVCPHYGDVQFGFHSSNIQVTVTGYDLAYHLIELSLTDDRGRLSLVRGGSDLTWEEAEPNPLYPGFFRLPAPVELTQFNGPDSVLDNAAYQMLCALVDDSLPSPSPLEDALFAQSLLARVEQAIGTAV